MLRTISRVVWGIIYLAVSLAFALALIKVWRFWGWTGAHHKDILFFFIGAGLCVFVWVLFRIDKNGFLPVLEHEITHYLMGTLFFVRATALAVNTEDDHTPGLIYFANRTNFLISLAPYFLPTFLIPTLFFLPLARTGDFKVYFVILGFIWGFYIISDMAQFSFVQRDIIDQGKFFSVCFLIFAWIITQGIIFSLLFWGWEVSVEFLKTGINNIGDLIRWLWMLIKR